MQKIIESLSAISGVVAVGLGGSRGLQIAHANSDYDLVLFRHGGEPLASAAISEALVVANSSTSVCTIEVFQKDLNLVAKEIDLAKKGKFHWATRQLFPHGDLSTNQISHIVYLEILAEKQSVLTNLKNLALPLPELLMQNLVDFFFKQASITLTHASKINKTIDFQYLIALISAFIFYVNIVTFALNGKYPIIEKGGARLIFSLPLGIQYYEQRIAVLFQVACHRNYAFALSEMNAMLQELKALVKQVPQSTI